MENEALTPHQRAEAGDALGSLGDPRRGVCTLEPDLIDPYPAGEFLYGEEKEKRAIKQPFDIARYPVTVAQFAMFVADGGYESPRFWGGPHSDGWRWRLKDHNVDWRGAGPINYPEYWLQPRWHGRTGPALAFVV